MSRQQLFATPSDVVIPQKLCDIVNQYAQNLTINQNATGTFSDGNFSFNSITISSDNMNVGANFGVGLFVTYNVGGSTLQGGREAIQGTLQLNSTTSASNANRNYVGLEGVATSIANDTGTGTGISTGKGALFGGSFITGLFTGATNFLNATGAEFNIFVQSGASVALKSILQVSSDPRDVTQGAVVDAMFWAYNQSGASPGWNEGILFDNGGGAGAWPIKSTGTILGTGGSGTAANGIDLSNTTFTGNAFKSNAFSVDGSGNLNANQISLGTHAFGLFDATNFYIGNRNGTGFAFITDTTPNNIYRAAAHIIQDAAGTTECARFTSSGGFSVGTTSDPGAGSIYVNNATFMLRTKTSFTNGAGAGAGTLTNAPAAGNPTKWISIDDNGTTRKIPAW